MNDLSEDTMQDVQGQSVAATHPGITPFEAPDYENPDFDGEHPRTMHPEISEDWHLWSTVVGHTTIRRLEALQKELPELISAVLATEDGLHLCSIDLDEDDAGLLAAMNSSLFAVAHAEAVQMGHEPESAGSSVVTISTGDVSTALLGFSVPAFGRLLLGISAHDVPLGSLMVRARNTARAIAELLSTEDVAAAAAGNRITGASSEGLAREV